MLVLITGWHEGFCCCWVTSVVSDSVWPHRRQPTRLPHPWDSPGKNTGVGCHFLLQCMKVKVKMKSFSHVWLATPRTAAYQAPPSMGFSRQEYWSGLPLPSLEGFCTAPKWVWILDLFWRHSLLQGQLRVEPDPKRPTPSRSELK